MVSDNTVYERAINSLKNHKVMGSVMFFGLCVIAASNFADAIGNICALIWGVVAWFG